MVHLRCTYFCCPVGQSCSVTGGLNWWDEFQWELLGSETRVAGLGEGAKSSFDECSHCGFSPCPLPGDQWLCLPHSGEVP